MHSVFGKINYGGLNTTAYTWDWYCHLVGDKASLLVLVTLKLLERQYNFTFLVSYEWVNEARVFVPDKPLPASVIQHSSLLGPFLSYEENEMII